MTALNSLLLTSVLLVFVQHAATAQVVVKDGDVSLTYDELAYIVTQMPPDMRSAAAVDEGDRMEILNTVLSVKKLAQEADKMPENSEGYWRLSTKIMNEKRKFVLQEYLRTLKVPDMSGLAAERYQTEKEKYALVPERRTSSHILFACAPGQCSREEMKVKAQKVLDELRAGADFGAMVQAHSGDPGTKAKDGKFDKWMTKGDTGVAGPYSEGLFTIEGVGNYSELVGTQFGVHIIRLDGIQEKHFLPFEDVKDKIIADLTTEYRKLSVKDYTSKYNMTEAVVIDGAAMEKIFSADQAKSE
jgi:peptidyl-prolyl cis-trans isomerase C